MTAQLPDTILLRGREFALVAWDGKGLFSPHEHGLRPDWGSTACYRGYVCTYGIGHGRLSLRNILFHNLGISGPEQVPELFGKAGSWSNGYVSYSFPDLDAPIPFSGALLAGDRWARDEWGCLHPAEGYKTVFELTFEGGRLCGIFDRGEAAEELRALPRSWMREGYELLYAWAKERFRGTYIAPPH